ncbi:carbohydrate ABC transporter permease [Catelliglobosispora koreensis]|uniref:carbohydrate ABC transporter permease n=1 Tax=Catelliglobosispora koreensis TaxID=129052 RepID=UPI000363CA8C|nr:carbohydrate ABC transporter permease [Catelliglobosispora koreensis]
MESDVRTLISPILLKRHKVLYFATLTFFVLLFAVVFFFPLYWMITGAVKDPQELIQPTPTLIPESFYPGTYLDAWRELKIGKFLLNTAMYAGGAWILQLLVDVPAAYALSKLRPWGGKLVLGAMLATLMLPMTALLIPAYLVVTNLGLLNTPWAIWLPAAANAFNIYVLKRFFDQIPKDLLDAAEIDGAGKIRMLWSVVLPLSRPVLAVVSILAIIGAWKDFLWPLLVLQEEGTRNISVALHYMAGTSGVTPFNQMLAGLVIASVPMIVVFVLFQRHILSGLSAGGMKG